MTIEEIKAKKLELVERSNKSTDIVEVKEINEELKQLTEELDHLERGAVPQGAEQHNRDILKAYGSKRTFAMNGGASGSISVNPLDGVALRSDESFESRAAKQPNGEALDLGKYIRGVITGDFTNAEAERRSMTSVNGSVLIPAVLSAKVLDTARNISFFTAAGCPVIPMTNGNITIARVSSDPTFKFYDELAEASESSLALEPVELKAKTARGYCYVSRELLESAQNLNGVLNQAFAGAIAQMIDAAGLYGQYNSTTSAYDTFAPSGVMNDTDINVIAMSSNDMAYTAFIKAIAQVRGANGTPDTLGTNANGEEAIALCHDSNNQYLTMPEVISKMNRVISNSFKSETTDGVIHSDAIILDKNAVAVGVQNNIRVRMIDTSDYCIKNNAVCFEVTAMLDIAVVRPSHICKITDVISN